LIISIYKSDYGPQVPFLPKPFSLGFIFSKDKQNRKSLRTVLSSSCPPLKAHSMCSLPHSLESYHISSPGIPQMCPFPPTIGTRHSQLPVCMFFLFILLEKAHNHTDFYSVSLSDTGPWPQAIPYSFPFKHLSYFHIHMVNLVCSYFNSKGS
jgi:hypothetical protein